jgi:hypothetical protein
MDAKLKSSADQVKVFAPARFLDWHKRLPLAGSVLRPSPAGFKQIFNRH